MGVFVPTQLERRQTWDLVELQGRKRKEAVRVPAGAASVQTPLKPRSGKSGFVPTLTEYMHSIYVLQGLKAAQF